ncbi:MAG: helix-turn-helix domain-containing protein [Erysipelotrichaceae bacterium]|nr:helix-turn-helix domain-containing protein [Erysipelotrichaceae bacterium]
MKFAANLRYLRRLNHISQNELADRMGYKSFTTIQKWEDGSAVPPYKTIVKLADFFQVDVDGFMNSDLTAGLQSEVPILGVVRGGQPLEAQQQYIGFEHVYPDDARHPDCFYLQVVGDSMKDARILPGDLLYVHRQDYLDNGDIGVVLLDNQEATVKKVLYKDNCMILQPANDAYEPIVLNKEDMQSRHVQIIGKVLHNRIKFA